MTACSAANVSVALATVTSHVDDPRPRISARVRQLRNNDERGSVLATYQRRSRSRMRLSSQLQVPQDARWQKSWITTPGADIIHEIVEDGEACGKTSRFQELIEAESWGLSKQLRLRSELSEKCQERDTRHRPLHRTCIEGRAYYRPSMSASSRGRRASIGKERTASDMQIASNKVVHRKLLAATARPRLFSSF